MAYIDITKEEIDNELRKICKSFGRRCPEKGTDTYEIFFNVLLWGISFGIKRVETFIREANRNA